MTFRLRIRRASRSKPSPKRSEAAPSEVREAPSEAKSEVSPLASPKPSPAASPPASPSPAPFALRALFAVVGLIVVFAYAICAWQVFGFAKFVWHLPEVLCFGAAFVADLLSLAGLFATYLLRRAPKGTQMYAWVVFLGMAGLSIAAAESYASWRFDNARRVQRPADALADALSHTDARVASAAIVVALALAVHLLIICRNHLSGVEHVDVPTGNAAAPPPPPPAARDRQAEKPPQVEKPQARTVKRPTQAPPVREAKPPTRRPTDVPPSERESLVRKVAAKELKAAEVAARFGVSARAIEMQAKRIRESATATPVATPLQSAPDLPEQPEVLPAATPVNGHGNVQISSPNGGATQ